MTGWMSRISIPAVALLLASVGVTGFVYVKTRKPAERTAQPVVVQVERMSQAVRTTAAKPFTFDYSITVTAADKTLTMSGNGSSDPGHGLAGLSLRFDGAAPGSPEAQAGGDFVVDSSHGLVEYIRMPLFAGHLPAGKSWVKVDVGAIEKARGIDVTKLRQSMSADPSTGFSFLRGAADVTVAGQETVGGVATTHYQATVDLRKLAASETDAATRDSLQRAIQLSGVTSYPAEAWVDDAGYMRRMRITMPERVAVGSQVRVATLTMTEELSNFGGDVHVAIPVPSSVVDVTALAGSSGKSA